MEHSLLAISDHGVHLPGLRHRNFSEQDKHNHVGLLCADIGNVELHSNKVDTFTPVGTMPFDGKDVTTAIYVRDTQTGVYVATGSIYFGLNKAEDKVVIKDDSGFPKQLKHKQSGSSDFDITLVSTAE